MNNGPSSSQYWTFRTAFTAIFFILVLLFALLVPFIGIAVAVWLGVKWAL